MRVEKLDLGLVWASGAPMPVLITSGGTAVVICHRPLLDGNDSPVMEIRFDGCLTARIGHPNDEVLHGHPLWSYGLEFYEAHEVFDSPLVAEHRRINAVHDSHSDAAFDGVRHFICAFQDDVVEVLAESISARALDGDLRSEVARAAAELPIG